MSSPSIPWDRKSGGAEGCTPVSGIPILPQQFGAITFPWGEVGDDRLWVGLSAASTPGEERKEGGEEGEKTLGGAHARFHHYFPREALDKR